MHEVSCSLAIRFQYAASFISDLHPEPGDKGRVDHWDAYELVRFCSQEVSGDPDSAGMAFVGTLTQEGALEQQFVHLGDVYLTIRCMGHRPW